jgi:hypothetical protein
LLLYRVLPHHRRRSRFDPFATSSLAVLSPSTFSRYRVATNPEGYQFLGYDALAAFRTLSGLYSTQHLPALFHAGTALGVPTLQGLIPPAGRYVLSNAHSLLWLHDNRPLLPVYIRWSPRKRPWRLYTFKLKVVACLSHSTSGPCSLPASVSPMGWFRPHWRPRPSWAFPSLGVSLSAPDHPGGSSHELIPRRAC